MKRNKLYIIIAILAIISLFSFSALCSDWKATGDEEVDVGEETEEEAEEETEEEAEEETEEETEEEAEEETEEEAEEEAEEETEEEAEEKTAPTISLEIYQDATPTDGICFYRVQANVTGNPSPSVTWNKDDSGGAWGTRKAQVNLNDPSETFTLIGTAENSEGTATDSITLSWGCAIPEPEPTEVEVEFSADFSKSGFIVESTFAYLGYDIILIGDTSVDKTMKGYLSFDISSISALEDITIKQVEVKIPGVIVQSGSPWDAGSLLNIKVYYYGETLDVFADFAVGGELVKAFDTSDTLDDLSFSSSKLKDELQKAVDINRDNFQLKLGLNTHSNNSTEDDYMFMPSNCEIEIKYEIIE
jgi:hypothetical protein